MSDTFKWIKSIIFMDKSFYQVKNGCLCFVWHDLDLMILCRCVWMFWTWKMFCGLGSLETFPFVWQKVIQLYCHVHSFILNKFNIFFSFLFPSPIYDGCVNSNEKKMSIRSWELKHLDPSWDFRRELGAKVRGLLTLLEHPINMAHLAKLFTAQLIISCNFDVNFFLFFCMNYSRHNWP